MEPRERQTCFSPSQSINKKNTNRKTMSFVEEVKDPNQTLFDTLMNDPVKRELVLKMIDFEKDNIEAYKKRELELKLQRDKNNKTPVSKLRRKHKMESPTELRKRLGLEEQRRELNSPTTSCTSSSVSPPRKVVPFDQVLKGVRAYVEIMVETENKSSGCKTLLRSMGATVRDTFSSDVTHVIYKDGFFSTYEKAKLIKAHLVSVLWVEEVRLTSSKVSEKNFPAMGVDYEVSEKVCQDYENEYKTVAGSSQLSICGKARRKTTILGDLNSLRAFSRASNRTQSESDDVIASSQDMEVASIISSRLIQSDNVSTAPIFMSDSSDSEISEINHEVFSKVISNGMLSSSDSSKNLSETPSKLSSKLTKCDSTELNSAKTSTSSLSTANVEHFPDTSTSSSSINSIKADNSLYLKNPRRKTLKDTSTSSLDLIETKITPKPRKTLAVRKIVEVTPIQSNLGEKMRKNTSNSSLYPIETKSTSKSRAERKTLATPKKVESSQIQLNSGAKMLESTSNTSLETKITPKLRSGRKTFGVQKIVEVTPNQSNLGEKMHNISNSVIKITPKPRSVRKTLALPKKVNASLNQSNSEGIIVKNTSISSLDSIETEITPKTRSGRKTLAVPKKVIATPNQSNSGIHKNASTSSLDSIGTEVTPKLRSGRKTLAAPKKVEVTPNKLNLEGKMLENTSITPKPRRKTVAVPKIIEATPECVKAPKLSQSERKPGKNFDADPTQTDCMKDLTKSENAKKNKTNFDLVDMDVTDCKNARISIESNASEDVGSYVTLRRPRKTVRTSLKFVTDSEGFKLPARCSKESGLTSEMSSLRLSTDTYVSSRKTSMGTDVDEVFPSLRISSQHVEDAKSLKAELVGNSKQLLEEDTNLNAKKSSLASTCDQSGNSKQSTEEEMSSLRLSVPSSNDLEMLSGLKLSDGESSKDAIAAKMSTITISSAGKRKSIHSSEESDSKRIKSIEATKKVVNTRRSMRQKPIHIDVSTADENSSPEVLKKIRAKPKKCIKASTDTKQSNKNKAINKENQLTDESTSSSDNSLKKGGRKLYNPNEWYDDTNILQSLEQEKMDILKNKQQVTALPEAHIAPIILTYKAMEIIKGRTQLTPNNEALQAAAALEEMNELMSKKVAKTVKVVKKVVHDPEADFQKSLHEEFVYKKPAPARRQSTRVASKKPIKYSNDSEDTLPIKAVARRSTMDFVSPKTPTPQRTQNRANNRKSTIVCTRFHRQDVAVFQQIVKKLGGFNVENDVSLRTTHLVSYEPARTINILRAIARGLWVLKPEWIYKSLENGKWLPEEDFEETTFSAAVQQCRLERQSFGPLYSMDVFENCGPIYITKSSNPPHADLEELVQLAKGTCTQVARNAAIVVGERLRYPDIEYVKETWVMDCITLNRCKNTKNYLLPPLEPMPSPSAAAGPSRRTSEHF